MKIEYVFMAILIGFIFMPREKDEVAASVGAFEEPKNYLEDFGPELIPDGKNNYRSGQLPTKQLINICKSGQIKHIIRLNGDGKDADGISIGQESAICRMNDVQFHFINVHSKYDPHLAVHELLKEGNVLIHCRHGFDRCGAMVGWHLRRLGYDLPMVIKHNGWEDYLQKKGPKYKVYYDLVANF